MLQVGDSMTAVYNGTFEDPLEFVPTDVPDSAWFWPEHGIVEDDTLKIFMSEFIKTSGTPGWNFAYDGLYLAKFSYPGLEMTDLYEIMYYHDNEVRYGNQLMHDGNYIYIYGRKALASNVPYIHVARAGAGNLEGPWEFYNGNEWVDDPLQTDRISFEAVSQQYAVFEHQGKYILLTQGIWLSAKIHTLTSYHPEGPFSNKTLIYTTPYPYPDMFTYNAWAHPQFDEDNELLVSYNSNGDFWQIFNNVELYRPNFIRVPYTMIDSGFISSSVSDSQHINPGVALFQNYPNPVKDLTTIEYELLFDSLVHLRIMDLSGRVHISQRLPVQKPGKGKIIMDLSTFPPGLYIYSILDQTRLLIKE